MAGSKTLALPKLFGSSCTTTHELVFVAFHDVAIPVGLVGTKQTPIFQLPSGEAIAESADIIKYVDENYGDAVLLQEPSGRADLAAWNKTSMMDQVRIIFPCAVKTPFPEFAQRKSCDYFGEGREQFAGSFAEPEKRTPELLASVDRHLAALDKPVFSDRLVNESGLSDDDLECLEPRIQKAPSLERGVVRTEVHGGGSEN